MARCSTLKKKDDRSEMELDDTNCHNIISYLRFSGPIFPSVSCSARLRSRCIRTVPSLASYEGSKFLLG